MSFSRPARFPLLKLPWLCIKCVMQNSDLVDIICFAMISSRTRRIVQHSKYPLKEIEVHPRWERKIYMGTTIGAATDRKTWCFKNGNYAYADKFVLQKNSQPFYTRQYIDHWGAHYLYSYTTGDTLDALKMGIDFLTDVFGCKIRQVFVNGDKLSELFGLGITSVKELFISDNGPVNVTGLKYLLETIKVIDSYIFSAPIPANFSCDPQIFNCRRINFACNHSADWVSLEFLCQLDVSRLCFSYQRFSKQDIVSYITYWFNSENRKLEYLYVPFNNPVSLVDFKIEELNPMPFCEKRRNRRLLAKGLKKMDMSSGMDILRKDGLLATLSTFSTAILFYVWHKRFPDDIQHN